MGGRKVIQIMLDGDGNMYALCDDGTIWERIYRTLEEYFWSRIQGPPVAPAKEEA
jgi:hypothetical protein